MMGPGGKTPPTVDNLQLPRTITEYTGCCYHLPDACFERSTPGSRRRAYVNYSIFNIYTWKLDPHQQRKADVDNNRDAVRQRRLRYLGHLLRLPRDNVVRRTLIAMTDGDNPNRYPKGSIFMDCQGSELKDLETLAVNRTAWRHKVAALVF